VRLRQLIPSLVPLAALTLGVLAIRAALRGDAEEAAWLALVYVYACAVRLARCVLGVLMVSDPLRSLKIHVLATRIAARGRL
jgi:hypothetical protein